jgi:hypothetical protein
MNKYLIGLYSHNNILVPDGLWHITIKANGERLREEYRRPSMISG